jgi:AbrB family looped-hinge helix DNA binding protein
VANHTPALEFLTTTRIGEKGQLTVPKEFRRELGLGAGAPFTVLRLGDGLILLPEQQRFEQLCKRISSKLTDTGLKPKDALASLDEARNLVYARHYGKPSAGVRRTRTHRQKLALAAESDCFSIPMY